MRRFWRISLLLLGLTVFALITYQSATQSREFNKNAGFHNGYERYFWWSSIRLDSDPLNRRALSAHPTCKDNPDGSKDCTFSDPVGIWIDPGWLVQGITIIALPAFLIGVRAVRVLGRLGVSELRTFMIFMPMLILGWLYLVGWLFDRWSIKRRFPAI
jgi:hypothetical protein